MRDRLRDDNDGWRGRSSGCGSRYDSDRASCKTARITFPHDEGDDSDCEDENSDDDSSDSARCESGLLGRYALCGIATQ